MVKRDRKAYTADGEEVTVHEHTWVQVSVTIHPNPIATRPILGALVLWRCTRRNCQGLRETNYQFKKPRSNSNPNRFSNNLRAIVELDS